MENKKEMLDAYWAAQAQFGPFDVGPDEYLRLTEEGLKVPPEYKLGFTACSGGWSGWSETLFSLSLHWQRDGKRRRPYMVIDLGPFHFQTGWLWYNPTADLSVDRKQ